MDSKAGKKLNVEPVDGYDCFKEPVKLFEGKKIFKRSP